MAQTGTVVGASPLDVVHERGCERGEAELVDAEGAGEGVARHALHDVRPAHDHAALGTAKQLVAGEQGEVNSSRDALLGHRLMGQAVGRRVQKTPAAQVVHQEEVPLVGHVRELGDGRGAVKPITLKLDACTDRMAAVFSLTARRKSAA